MKKLSLILFAFLSFIIALSCASDDSSDTSTNPFQGTWEGTFIDSRGQSTDNGVWSVTINAVGEISGTATSFVFNETYQTIGTVSDDGDFRATAGGGVSSGAVFIGKLNGDSGSGTWENLDADLSGTWQGTKQ